MKADPGFFGLENAGWPALLVDPTSTIHRANQAAFKLFGAALESASPLLSVIWAEENTSTPEQFLAQWERAPAPTVWLRFRPKEGNGIARLVSVCSLNRESEKYFLLQLMPEADHAGTDKNRGFETSFAQKQKLDCALQMARSVALDESDGSNRGRKRRRIADGAAALAGNRSHGGK